MLLWPKRDSKKIEWAESRMPVLMKLRGIHSKKKTLQGVKIARTPARYKGDSGFR